MQRVLITGVVALVGVSLLSMPSALAVDQPGVVSERGKYQVAITKAPTSVRIANVSSKNCQDPVTIRVKGPRLAAGKSLTVSIDFRAEGVEPTPTVDFRSDLKTGRIYTVFPYLEPEVGENYKVTFCGSIVGRLNLQAVPPGRYKAHMDVTLYRPVGVRWTKLAADSHAFTLDWRGLSG